VSRSHIRTPKQSLSLWLHSEHSHQLFPLSLYINFCFDINGHTAEDMALLHLCFLHHPEAGQSSLDGATVDYYLVESNQRLLVGKRKTRGYKELIL
jgi:hypothetical protein